MSSSTDGNHNTAEIWVSRLLSVTFRFLLWMPWIWFMLFGLLVLAAALESGHLPLPGQPDPKDVSTFGFLYMPSLTLLVMVMATAPVSLGITLVRLTRGIPAFLRRGEAVVYLLGFGLFLLFVLSDAGGLITWLGD